MNTNKPLNPQENTIEDYQKRYGTKWLRVYNSDKKGRKYSTYKGKTKSLWTDWDYYNQAVDIVTENNKHNVPGIHKRGFYTYHIDHKISKRFGYDNGISPEAIGHPSNLHMLWWKDNVLKRTDNIIDEENKWILQEEY